VQTKGIGVVAVHHMFDFGVVGVERHLCRAKKKQSEKTKQKKIKMFDLLKELKIPNFFFFFFRVTHV
jgi:hypothetical protein